MSTTVYCMFRLSNIGIDFFSLLAGKVESLFFSVLVNPAGSNRSIDLPPASLPPRPFTEVCLEYKAGRSCKEVRVIQEHHAYS